MQLSAVARGGVLALLLAPAAGAGVLPEDRADVMYHLYDGGGVQIDGPSLLVRKKFAERVAVSASYYVDMVSSASIDVVTTASPYSERREQFGLGFEYLRGKVTYGLGYTHSAETDYEADTAVATISQDMFGDLTSVTLSFARGWDRVARRGDALFSDRIDRRIYGLDVSQIVSKRLIMGLAWETITEEGFLNNPYRQVRFVDPSLGRGYSYEEERYPQTRTGNALSLRARYFLPYRAALHGSYRWYNDTWGLNAGTVEVGYTQPLAARWTLDLHYRFHTQQAADFYSDLFPRRNFQNFLARDKELSTLQSHSAGFGLSYDFPTPRLRYVDKAAINLKLDRIRFQYDDFRDLRRAGAAPGAEPLYGFEATVLQLYFSGWF